jgi:hypothetical protein
MVTDIIAAVIGLLDKIIPDPAQREAAKLNLLRAENRQELEEIKTRLAAIMQEAQSPDPWTSRARPAFLYVVYIMLLASIPMGLIYAVNPETAARITEGFQAWLKAIPESITQLFGVVMLGYIGGRSWEKVRGVSK